MGIYDIFSGGRPFDKAEWAAQKQAQREEIYEQIDNTCKKMMADGSAFLLFFRLKEHSIFRLYYSNFAL